MRALAITGLIALTLTTLTTPALAAPSTHGAIGTFYKGHKALTGNPTGSEHKLAKGAYQNFSKGKVHWSSKTGAHFTTGKLQQGWAALKWERGYLSYPTSEQKCGLPDNGCYQSFSGGRVYVSSGTKAYAVKKNSAIDKAWGQQRYERGSLGYPTSNEKTSKGKTTQSFQGGTITATGSKATIAYAHSTASTTMKVASYNVACDKCSKLKWDSAARGGAVAADIKAQAPDVIGIQEASQGWLKDSKGNAIDKSQFDDLAQRLRTGGYKITNSKRNNCVNAKTPTKCVYKHQGASQGTRVFYNERTVKLLRADSLKLTSPSGNPRYFAWGEFQNKKTNKRFFFGTTHLSPGGSASLHTTQMKQITAEVKKKNSSKLPVIITGDFNSSNFRKDGYNPPAKVLSQSGYKDFLGHTFGTYNASSSTPKDRIHAEYSTFNGFNKKIAVAPKKGQLGSTIDYIFGSKNINVKQWETVVHIKSPGVLSSTPSDHNMIRANVTL